MPSYSGAEIQTLTVAAGILGIFISPSESPGMLFASGWLPPCFCHSFSPRKAARGSGLPSTHG